MNDTHELTVTRLMRAPRAAGWRAFTAGWHPTGPFTVGIMEFADEAGGTRYTGRARHRRAEDADKHRAMGFEAGWAAVAEQWEEVAKGLAGRLAG